MLYLNELEDKTGDFKDILKGGAGWGAASGCAPTCSRGETWYNSELSIKRKPEDAPCSL